MNDLSIVISSCDKYSDTWKPFFTMLKAHWPSCCSEKFFLLTETKGFSFEGLDIEIINTPTKSAPSWSEMLLHSLSKITTRYILLFLDDFWLTKDVDIKRLNNLFTFMKSTGNAGYMCLRAETEKMSFCGSLVVANTLTCEHPEIIECGKQMPYRITTQAGIWKKSFLWKILRRHESAWEFESRGTWRSQFCRERIFDVKQSLFYYPCGGVLGQGRFVADYQEQYPIELTALMIQTRGTISVSEFRKKEPPKNFKYYCRKLRSALPKLF